MKLVTFSQGTQRHIGRLEGEEIVDLSSVATDMLSFLEAGPSALDQARQADGTRVALADARLEAPLARPPKILETKGLLPTNYQGPAVKAERRATGQHRVAVEAARQRGQTQLGNG